MTFLRRHLSYTNVVATMALVFAMGGSAIAAKHYLISSTSQINPKVLKKLSGKAGPRGLTGATGATGAPGIEGAKGGPGSPTAVLSSGQSESGNYDANSGRAKVELLEEAITFPIPLAAGIVAGNVEYTTSHTAHCSGAGHAAAGFLCVYSKVRVGLGTPAISSQEPGAESSTSSPTGFFMLWGASAGESVERVDLGTYSVTAP
jgi:hypothetical protein